MLLRLHFICALHHDGLVARSSMHHFMPFLVAQPRPSHGFEAGANGVETHVFVANPSDDPLPVLAKVETPVVPSESTGRPVVVRVGAKDFQRGVAVKLKQLADAATFFLALPCACQPLHFFHVGGRVMDVRGAFGQREFIGGELRRLAGKQEEKKGQSKRRAEHTVLFF